MRVRKEQKHNIATNKHFTQYVKNLLQFTFTKGLPHPTKYHLI